MKALLLVAALAACTTEASLGHNAGQPGTPRPPSSIGAMRWAVRIDAAANTNTDPNSLALRQNGDVIVGGTGMGPGMHGFVIARASQTGAELWRVKFTGTGTSQVMGIATDPAGNVYASGTFRETVDFGGQSLTSGTDPTTPPPTDTFVAKYDPTGALSWVRALGCIGTCVGQALAVRDDGTVLAGGWLSGIVDLGNGPVGAMQGAQTDGFVVAYSPTGTRLGGQMFPDAAPRDLVTLPNGDVVVAGTGNGAPPFNGGFVARLDSSFAPVWVHATPVQPGLPPLMTHGIASSGDQIVSVSGTDLVLLEGLDLAGVPLWTSSVSDVFSMTLAATPNGFVVGGEVNERSADFGTGAISPPLFMASYGPDGAIAEARSVGALANTNQQLTNVVAMPDGSIAYTSSLVTATDFGGTMLAPTGGRDTALVVLDPPPSVN